MSTLKSPLTSIFYFLGGITSIIAIRFFLESLSSPYLATVNIYSLVWIIHYSLFYFSLFLSLVFLLHFLTGETVANLAKKILPFSIIIIFPPIIDLIITKGSGQVITYLLLSPQELWKNFITLHVSFLKEISPGLKICTAIIDITLALYVWRKTRSLWRSALCLFFGYAIIFFYDALPSLVFFSSGKLSTNIPAVGLNEMLVSSWYGMRIKEDLFSLFNRFVGMIWWIILIMQISLFFFLTIKEETLAFIKNLRWTRSFYYFFIFLLGIRIAGDFNFIASLSNPFNIATILTYLLSGLLGVWSAIVFNDFHDQHIDEISSNERPLISKKISPENYTIFGFASALLMIIGLLLVGYAAAISLLVGQAIYFLYTAEPFRLKRHFIYSSLATGAAATLVAISAYFLAGDSQILRTLPLKTMLYLFVVFALIGNIKDIKDYMGDKKIGISTIPVVFGPDKGKQIIALFFSLVTISIPFALGKTFLLIPSFVLAILFSVLITKKPYHEDRIFMLLFFCFILILFFL